MDSRNDRSAEPRVRPTGTDRCRAPALVAGMIGPFIVMRQMSFPVHGSSELSLTGAAFALLTGLNVGMGALVGSAFAAVPSEFWVSARERDSAIGAVLAFGLGMAVLFIHLYPGRTGTSFALLTGQIVGVGYSGLVLLVIVVVVMAVLAVSYRRCCSPPQTGGGGGCPRSAGARIGHRSPHWSVSWQPRRSDRRSPPGHVAADHSAAAAARVFRSPTATIVASIVFAEVSAVGGIVLSLAPGVPVSVFVTTIRSPSI